MLLQSSSCSKHSRQIRLEEGRNVDGWQGVCGGVGLGSVAIGTVGTSSCGGLALRASERASWKTRTGLGQQ